MAGGRQIREHLASPAGGADPLDVEAREQPAIRGDPPGRVSLRREAPGGSACLYAQFVSDCFRRGS
jgi:hypothetical protein